MLRLRGDIAIWVVIAAELATAGLRRSRWWTDADGDFGLSLAVK